MLCSGTFSSKLKAKKLIGANFSGQDPRTITAMFTPSAIIAAMSLQTIFWLFGYWEDTGFNRKIKKYSKNSDKNCK
jgi:hypothetical protein